MRILFGNHHLEVRAGSELFTVELARSFRARGNDVAIFTFFKGELAAQIEAEGIRVFDPDGRRDISSFLPDIVQTCHLPCAHFLRAVVPDAIRIHAILGIIPPLEAPPLDGDAFSLGLAVSEEVVDRIDQTPFGRDVDVTIFRNWFDDSEVAILPAAPRRIRRVAVISNHIASELVDALVALQTAGDFEVDYFGVQRKSVVVDGPLLVKYDLIVSIGRTVLMAAAWGVPCIVADIHGSDGLLTPDNLDNLRTRNFSGRNFSHAITKTHLQQEIEKIGSYDREKLRCRIIAEYALSSRVEWLALRYEALLADRRASDQKCPAARSFRAPSEGLVYAEMTTEVRRLRERLAVAQSEIDATTWHVTRINWSSLIFAGRILRPLINSAVSRAHALMRLLRVSVRPFSDKGAKMPAGRRDLNAD
jgi:hypothetical protein